MKALIERSKLIFAARLIAGLTLFGLVLWRVGLRDPWLLLKSARPGILCAAVLLYAAMFFVKTMRWRMLLLRRRIRLSVSRALEVYLFSSLFGALTPGRVGGAVRAVLPGRANGKYAESLACATVDKFFDMGLAALLLLLSSRSELLSSAEARGLLSSGFAIILAMAGSYIAARIAAVRGIGLPVVLARILPDSWRRALIEQPDRFIASGLACARDSALPAAALTGLFWAAHVSCHYLILLSLGGQMDFWYFVLCLTFASLVEFVPVTVCGLGAREYLLVFLFERVGLSADLALAFALMNIVFTYAVTGIFMFFVRIVRIHAGYSRKR